MYSFLDFSVMILLLDILRVSSPQSLNLNKMFYPLHLTSNQGPTFTKIYKNKVKTEIPSTVQVSISSNLDTDKENLIGAYFSPTSVESLMMPKDKNDLVLVDSPDNKQDRRNRDDSDFEFMSIEGPVTIKGGMSLTEQKRYLRRTLVFDGTNQDNYETDAETQEELFIPISNISISNNLDVHDDREREKHNRILDSSALANNEEDGKVYSKPVFSDPKNGTTKYQPNATKELRRILVFDADEREKSKKNKKKLKNDFFHISLNSSSQENYKVFVDDRLHISFYNISNVIESKYKTMALNRLKERQMQIKLGLYNKYPEKPIFKRKPVFVDNLLNKSDTTVADNLARQVRVLCWVMTHPKAHRTKAIHVKQTWGKRCNILLFMSTKTDTSLPTIALPVREGRNSLWGKTKLAFQYVYEHHWNDADWFLKADDDTYVIVENLRYMLAEYNPDDPIYFGCRLKPFTPQGYMSGGAGYVLSRSAVYKFVNEALPSEKLCKRHNGGSEDAEIGICLHNVGVKAMDSLDKTRQGRFFPFMPHDHIIVRHDPDFWYWESAYYPEVDGLHCCSPYAVSFHYVKPRYMYIFDYLIYYLKLYGIDYNTPPLPSMVHHGHKYSIPAQDKTKSISLTTSPLPLQRHRF